MERLLRYGKQFPGNFSPFLLVLLSLDKEGLTGQSALLPRGFIFFDVSPLLFYEDDRLKYRELRGKVGSTVLRGFYYRLTLSRSDFSK